ncbi:L-methionine/branched-chain amino acid transporter [Shewanella surugensis]|uniref:L-methionine/branched-chain amino acid transporter n=1 Tax=Shewanella surugensis TaxID=212020 RepID=A0ABT0LBX3_9GAMM|nr:L-methionine/branched-chain amino acid transporter [Shewanella surugensis]MCL1125158.1 L-methionine/branched-chain amino acid transporter [Shewanella surugensis]
MTGKIGRWQGAGLMATTLLGTGVFILPQLTIEVAGSGALIAWLLLTLAIIPVTLVFGRLASVLPHAAGPAYFVEKAFGQSAGRTIGLLFVLVVPLGAPAAILMTFQFVNELVSLSGWSQVGVELLLLSMLFLLNQKGIQVSAKIQFMLTLGVVAVVVGLFGAIGTNVEDIKAFTMHIEPNANTIAIAAGIAFWSFLGVEAMTHLANDFRDPKKDMIPAMMIGTLLVGVVYLGCTLLLLLVPTDGGVAMVGIFNQLLGGYGAQIIAVLGIASGLATVNVYTASVSRLIWSFSCEGVLPRYFSKLSENELPVRASNTVLVVMALVVVLTYMTGQALEDLISWTNGVFVVIYFASMLAAGRLLSRRYLPLVMMSSCLCLVLGIALAANMIYALWLVIILFGGLEWHKQYQKRRQAALV